MLQNLPRRLQISYRVLYIIIQYTGSSQEDEIQDFLNNLDTMPNFESLSHIFSLDFQDTTLVEISLGASLYICSDLDPSHREQLVNLLRNHLNAFAWGYEDIKGIPPETFTHHIYIQDGV